jgi:hypothetical protein
LEGDNVNPAEDSVPLPTPVVLNNGRRVKLETGYYGNHPDVNKDYEIRLEIFQDGQLIGFEVDKSSPDNTLAANAKFSLILVKLSI